MCGEAGERSGKWTWRDLSMRKRCTRSTVGRMLSAPEKELQGTMFTSQPRFKRPLFAALLLSTLESILHLPRSTTTSQHPTNGNQAERTHIAVPAWTHACVPALAWWEFEPTNRRACLRLLPGGA